MIEVIKHGQKKFKAICKNCGCEFTYELSDMKPLGGVDCPDCGEYVVHQIFGNNNGNLYYPPNCRDISEVYDNEIKNCDYVVNAGVSWDNLNPLYTSSSKEAAIDMARHLPIECVEVVYSPCDNWNVDEIVWSNRR